MIGEADVSFCCDLFSGFCPTPHYQNDPEFQRATQWYRETEPIASSQYAEIVAACEKDTETLRGSLETLDRKAEWTLLIASGVAGVLLRDAAAIRANVAPLVLLFLAMFYCLRCRMPLTVPTTLSPRAALDLVAQQRPFQANLLLAMEGTHAALRSVASWKASCVRGAGYLLLAGAIVAAAVALV